MTLRYRHIKEISCGFSRYLFSGISYEQSCSRRFSSSFLKPSRIDPENINENKVERSHVQITCPMSATVREILSEEEFLSFLESVIDKIEGPYHCWMNSLETRNSLENRKETTNKDQAFLVLYDSFLKDSMMFDEKITTTFEKVKLLQQRFPKLQVFAFYSGESVLSISTQSYITQIVMREYITFPILLSTKDFMKMANKVSYLLFRGFTSPVQLYKMDVELETISKAIEEFILWKNVDGSVTQGFKKNGMMQFEFLKDPQASYLLRNLFLYFPGGISADEYGNRIFVSDSNHHRVIIFDGRGEILDCIGSSPGFEDGSFESAKLFRPAASFYHTNQDCLFFVDSENHAIRRADLKQRMIETIHPAADSKKGVSRMWLWILDKLGISHEVELNCNNSYANLIFPWHLMMSDDNLLIFNRSLSTLWIMNVISGEIKEHVIGISNIMGICGKMMMEKVSLFKQVSGNCLQSMHSNIKKMSNTMSDIDFISSVAALQNDVLLCDTVGQKILRYNKETGDISSIHFSNYGPLGLPYWLDHSLEKVIVSGDSYGKPRNVHSLKFEVLPGKCDIHIDIGIPDCTELAAPLDERCIWRQARGSAAEVSESKESETSTDKVGVAQQWFDELDNLAFSDPGLDFMEENKENIIDKCYQLDNKVSISSAIQISPGTSEVVIYAVFYLKISETIGCETNLDKKIVEQILDLSENNLEDQRRTNACVHLLSESCKDPRDVVFMKPMHLTIKLDCGDHPKADNSKDIISTDSTLNIKLSLL